MSDLSPELLLAAACCRWPPSAERDAAVRVAAADVDWPRFLAATRRHRVEGLANDALRRAEVVAPASVASALAASAAAIARENLAFAAEARRIQQAFKSAGLAFLFVKGATLDMLAYGTIGLKRARDIDMVVDPAALLPACALLAELGYDRTIPGPEVGPDQLAVWARSCKETNWRHPRTGIVVELHSQLMDNAALLPGIGAASPAQAIEIGRGIALPTLRTEELFAYLCVHGATHAWSRLKWVADVAALLSHFDAARIEALYRRSLELGSGRCSAQALILCDILFETPLTAALRAEIAGDRAAEWLAKIGLNALGQTVELDDTVLGTVPIHLSHFLFGRGLRFKAAELGRKLTNHEDQARLQLPRALHFLYPLISVPSWIVRRARGPHRPA